MSDGKKESTAAHSKSDGYKNTGWSNLRSTPAFRALNFELFVRPNKVVMVLGSTFFLGSVGYIVYMNLTDSIGKKKYTTIDEDGTLISRERTSKWD